MWCQVRERSRPFLVYSPLQMPLLQSALLELKIPLEWMLNIFHISKVRVLKENVTLFEVYVFLFFAEKNIQNVFSLLSYHSLILTHLIATHSTLDSPG